MRSPRAVRAATGRASSAVGPSSPGSAIAHGAAGPSHSRSGSPAAAARLDRADWADRLGAGDMDALEALLRRLRAVLWP